MGPALMSAEIVPSTPAEIVTLSDEQWAKIDAEIRSLVAADQAAIEGQQSRGMQLAADLTLLYRDMRWMDSHTTVGQSTIPAGSRGGSMAVPSSERQFCLWTTQRYGLHVRYVAKLLTYHGWSERICRYGKMESFNAFTALGSVTSRNKPLSDRDKYMPQIVSKAADLAKVEAPGEPITAKHITAAAKEIEAAVMPPASPKIKARRSRVLQLSEKATAALKLLCDMGQFGVVDKILTEITDYGTAKGAGK
jgi:hypothetical protein